MVITIRKGAKKEEVRKALLKLSRKKKISPTAPFFGKLKDVFGDGIDYQKSLRNEW